MRTSIDDRNNAAANAGLSPESVARYLQEPPAELQQYAFFIGAWSCEVRAYPPGGGEPLALRGEWRAHWTHGGRMLVDDLSIFLPGGEGVAGWMNLRTWCAETGRWEISSQRSLSPSAGTVTHGCWRDEEMQLHFETQTDGASIEHFVRFHAITADSFEWIWQSRARGHDAWKPFASISAQRMEDSA